EKQTGSSVKTTAKPQQWQLTKPSKSTKAPQAAKASEPKSSNPRSQVAACHERQHGVGRSEAERRDPWAQVAACHDRREDEGGLQGQRSDIVCDIILEFAACCEHREEEGRSRGQEQRCRSRRELQAEVGGDGADPWRAGSSDHTTRKEDHKAKKAAAELVTVAKTELEMSQWQLEESQKSTTAMETGLGEAKRQLAGSQKLI
ncbi:10599_t:CDS:2, partial [Scutellospora calospora]